MKIAKIILAGAAALIVIGSGASAQQALTGTVTIVDRIHGTVAIRQTQGGTVGANAGGAARRVQGARRPGVGRRACRRQGHLFRYRSGWGQDDHETSETVNRQIRNLTVRCESPKCSALKCRSRFWPRPEPMVIPRHWFSPLANAVTMSLERFVARDRLTIELLTNAVTHYPNDPRELGIAIKELRLGKQIDPR